MNVNSDKYKEEKIKRKAEYEKATHDSDKEENIQEEEQADYYEDSIVTQIGRASCRERVLRFV